MASRATHTTSNDAACPVCRTLYEDPRLLPCLHALCAACAQQLLVRASDESTRARCPMCRTVFDAAGVESRADDLVALVAKVRLAGGGDGDDDVAERSTRRTCSECEERAADLFCEQCSQYFCGDCCPVVHKPKVFRTHTPLPLAALAQSGPLALCATHATEREDVYCVDCAMPLCTRCVVASHNQHRTQPANEAALAKRTQLRDELAPVTWAKPDVEQALSDVDACMAELEATIAGVETQIRGHFDAVIRAAEARKRALLGEADGLRKSGMKRLRTQREELERVHDAVDGAAATVARVAERGRDVDVLRMERGVRERLEALRREVDAMSCAPAVEAWAKLEASDVDAAATAVASSGRIAERVSREVGAVSRAVLRLVRAIWARWGLGDAAVVLGGEVGAVQLEGVDASDAESDESCALVALVAHARGLRGLTLRWCLVDAATLDGVLAGVRASRTLETLALVSCGLDDASCERVAEAVRASESIREVDVSGNEGVGDRGAAALAYAVEQSGGRVRRLVMRWCRGVGQQTCARLQRRLGERVEIKLAVEEWMRALYQQWGVPDLLTRTPFIHGNNSKQWKIGGMTLKLMTAGLDDKSIDDRGCLALAAAIANSPGIHSYQAPYLGANQIEALDLFSNQIGDAGATALAQALPSLTALKVLDIANNRIGAAGATALAQALPRLTALRGLLLTSNQIGSAGAAAMAQVLPRLTALQELSLRSNQIGSAGATAMAQVLPRLTALYALWLNNNGINAPTQAALRAAWGSRGGTLKL